MTNFLLSQCSSHKNSTEYTNFCWIKVPSSSPLQLSWLLCVMYQINNYPPIFIGTNRTTGVPRSSNALHISHALYIFYHWESFDMECRMGWLLCDCCVGNKIRCLCIFHMSACLGWIGGVISTNEVYSRILQHIHISWITMVASYQSFFGLWCAMLVVWHVSMLSLARYLLSRIRVNKPRWW